MDEAVLDVLKILAGFIGFALGFLTGILIRVLGGIG